MNSTVPTDNTLLLVDGTHINYVLGSSMNSTVPIYNTLLLVDWMVHMQ